MQDLHIRSVEDSDEPAIDAIYDACEEKQQDVKGAFSGPLIAALVSPEDQKEYKAEGWPILVGVIDEHIVGIGCVVPEREWLRPGL